MPNTAPIFTLKGDISTNDGTTMPTPLTLAAPDYTGIHANYQLIWTADAVDGGYLRGIKFVSSGTNVATVARVFVNNGSSPGTATNNAPIGQISLPITTASNTAMTSELYLPIDMAISPGFRIYVGIATAVAAGWTPTADAGQYA